MKLPVTPVSACCAPDSPDCGPPTVLADRSLHDGGADEALAELARALGHPARVRLLRILVQRGACVCGELVAELPLAQSTVSQHLKILKDAGLVRGTIEGPRSCYCVDPGVLARAHALLGALAVGEGT